MNFNSRFFHISEFGCHSGTPYPSAWLDRLTLLCSVLDVIRADWGGPIRVVSGYRTLAHNTAVGGARASQHMEGRAADIVPMVGTETVGAAVADLHARIMRLYGAGQIPLLGGIGYYPGRWCHCDVRQQVPEGHLARWQGVGIGDELA